MNGNVFPGLTVWDVHKNENVFLGLTVCDIHTNENVFPGLTVWNVHKNENVFLRLTVCDIHTYRIFFWDSPCGMYIPTEMFFWDSPCGMYIPTEVIGFRCLARSHTSSFCPSLCPRRAYPRRFLGRVGRTPLYPTLTWRRFQMTSRKGVKNRLYITNAYLCSYYESL